MQTFQLTSFPLEQVRDNDELAWSFGAWFRERPYPIRLLAYSRAFDMRPARVPLDRQVATMSGLVDITRDLRRHIECIRNNGDRQSVAALRALPAERFAELLAICSATPALQQNLQQVVSGGLSDVGLNPLSGITPSEMWQLLALALDQYGWRLPWLREAQRMYDTLGEHHLRRADYFLLTWEPPHIGPAALALTMQSAFQRPALAGVRLPTLLRGNYCEQDTFLAPQQPGLPFYAGMLSYDMRGTIDIAVLHDLISRPYDLAIAIDIQTRSAGRVLAATERAFAVSQAAAEQGSVKDARAERQTADAERALHELTRQNLHDVQLGVLVAGDTQRDLEAHVAEVSELLGGRLKLMRPHGVQRQILNLWSTNQAKQIDLPWKRRNLYSTGVGCLAGMLTYHRPSRTDGLLWGIDAQRSAPLMRDLFADRMAAHVVVLGKTGFGKTYFLNLMATRAAALSGHRVIMIDAFENAKRMERAIGPGVRGNWLTLETPINPMDIVFDADTGDWQAAQVEHVISQLAMLVGTLGMGSNNQKVFQPRLFSPEERGVLDAALSALYAEYSTETPVAEMPLLEDLIDILDDLAQPEGIAIADTLSKLLFGTADRSATMLTRLGQRFNAPTGVDWRFERAITCFDLSQITTTAPEWLPFYYAQVIGAVNRFMRNPHRDRTTPTMLIIDEFGYAAQVESVARMAADICKVARKYGIGLMVVDQNPHTFQNPIGREIIENAIGKILFHLDPSAVETAAILISDLTPGHIAFLPKAERGQTVAVFGNDVYLMHVESSPLEHRQFNQS
jgi:hypothetical protein